MRVIAPKYTLLICFFLLFHLSLSFCSSPSSKRDSYFQKWISWNAKNYHKTKYGLESINAQASGKAASIDQKLEIAEMNKTRISISQDGTGDFKTINEAINTIPLHNTRRVVLDIKPGVYREKINIPRTMCFITLLGNASDPPSITGNDTAAVTRRDGLPVKTYGSATVAVEADYFIAINIKFENTAPHEAGVVGGQAVALRISGSKAAFYNCSFYGSQDTLYDHKGLHYFNNCFIQGSVDFISGYGRSLYENCNLNSVAKKVASVTAQKRSIPSMSSGFSFKNCTVTGTGLVYLGRAWGDYSTVVFSYTFMDKIVLAKGWSDWGKRDRDSRVYYGEYKCSGPGANLSGRVGWARGLTEQEAIPFLGTYYIYGDSWLINPHN